MQSTLSPCSSRGTVTQVPLTGDGSPVTISSGRSVALLVLLSRSARARIIAADLGLTTLHGLRFLFAAREEHRLLFRFLRRQRALDALRLLLLAFARDDDVHLPEVFDDAILDALHHFLEEIERFLL